MEEKKSEKNQARQTAEKKSGETIGLDELSALAAERIREENEASTERVETGYAQALAGIQGWREQSGQELAGQNSEQPGINRTQRAALGIQASGTTGGLSQQKNAWVRSLQRQEYQQLARLEGQRLELAAQQELEKSLQQLAAEEQAGINRMNRENDAEIQVMQADRRDARSQQQYEWSVERLHKQREWAAEDRDKGFAESRQLAEAEVKLQKELSEKQNQTTLETTRIRVEAARRRAEEARRQAEEARRQAEEEARRQLEASLPKTAEEYIEYSLRKGEWSENMKTAARELKDRKLSGRQIWEEIGARTLDKRLSESEGAELMDLLKLMNMQGTDQQTLFSDYIKIQKNIVTASSLRLQNQSTEPVDAARILEKMEHYESYLRADSKLTYQYDGMKELLTDRYIRDTCAGILQGIYTARQTAELQNKMQTRKENFRELLSEEELERWTNYLETTDLLYQVIRLRREEIDDVTYTDLIREKGAKLKEISEEELESYIEMGLDEYAMAISVKKMEEVMGEKEQTVKQVEEKLRAVLGDKYDLYLQGDPETISEMHEMRNAEGETAEELATALETAREENQKWKLRADKNWSKQQEKWAQIDVEDTEKKYEDILRKIDEISAYNPVNEEEEKEKQQKLKDLTKQKDWLWNVYINAADIQNREDTPISDAPDSEDMIAKISWQMEQNAKVEPVINQILDGYNVPEDQREKYHGYLQKLTQDELAQLADRAKQMSRFKEFEEFRELSPEELHGELNRLGIGTIEYKEAEKKIPGVTIEHNGKHYIKIEPNELARQERMRRQEEKILSGMEAVTRRDEQYFSYVQTGRELQEVPGMLAEKHEHIKGEKQGGFYGTYDNLSEREKTTYFYYVGKGEYKTAHEYLEKIEDQLNQRQGKKMFAEMNADSFFVTRWAKKLQTEEWSGLINAGRSILIFLDPVNADKYSRPTALEYAGMETLDKAGEWGSLAGNLAYGMGNAIPLLTATAIATAASGGTALVPVAVGAGVTFMQSYGEGYQTAYREGRPKEERYKYAMIKSVTETGLYLLTSGLGAEAGGVLMNGMDQAVGRALGKTALSAGKKAALQTGAKMLLRGASNMGESAMGAALDRGIRQLAYGEEDIKSLEQTDYGKQFLMAFALGMASEVPYVTRNYKRYMKQYGGADAAQGPGYRVGRNMYDMAAEDINAGRRKDNRLEAAEQMGNRSLEWIPERKGNLYEQAAEDIWGTRWRDRGSNVEAAQLAAEELHKGRFEEKGRLAEQQDSGIIKTYNSQSSSTDYVELSQNLEKQLHSDGYRVLNIENAEIANANWEKMGYTNPPIAVGTRVYKVEAGTHHYVRTYNTDWNNYNGRWIMRIEDIEGLTAAEIAKKYAMPSPPNMICDVILPSTVRLEISITGEQPNWVSDGGGNIQYGIKDVEPMESWFVNKRSLD